MRPIEQGKFTPADLELTPDDGMRYEVVDGQLLVTPTPPTIHQASLVELATLLLPACPERLKVFLGPLEFRASTRRAVLPDLLVVGCDDVGERWIEEPLVLAVEVLAPTTRLVDQLVKRRVYEEAGVEAYWMFDPDEVVLTALELEDRRYHERVIVQGDEEFEAQLPFPVTVVPGDLIR